ncbi:MAG: hypothetical protein OK455_02385 [Thaumarchaeota archaeon]|nr:hypothetical protein [Nitrososphaerota archaeon]
MSTEERDEKRVYVDRSPGNQGMVVVEREEPVVEPVVERVKTVQEVPSSQRAETIVKHRSTNTGALLAMVIGVVVLLAGIGLIASQIPFIPWPYGLYVVLGFGFLLLVMGASMITSRT